MISALDVAAYILRARGAMTAWKLQKLVYYAQAWSSVWDPEPLFEDRIEAWANGPVTLALYYAHKGQFTVSEVAGGDANNLTDVHSSTVDAVLNAYGDKSPQWLSDLTHTENPWKNARIGLSDSERGNNEITIESMAEYYESLLPG